MTVYIEADYWKKEERAAGIGIISQKKENNTARLVNLWWTIKDKQQWVILLTDDWSKRMIGQAEVLAWCDWKKLTTDQSNETRQRIGAKERIKQERKTGHWRYDL